MTNTLLPIFVVLLATATITGGALWLRLRKLQKRFEQAFANLDSSQNLPDTLAMYYEKIALSEKQLESIEKGYQHLAEIGTKALQKTAVVRFNPFRNTGSDQSFVLALLNNHDSGLLLTSIHSREGTRIYIKPITYGASEYTLSNEEQKALEQAKTSKAADNKQRKRAPKKAKR